jgi:hypothetical protein
MSHSIHLESDGIDEKFTLKARPFANFISTRQESSRCYDHHRSMNGEIVVLAR